jgi:hypothetical protein
MKHFPRKIVKKTGEDCGGSRRLSENNIITLIFSVPVRAFPWRFSFAWRSKPNIQIYSRHRVIIIDILSSHYSNLSIFSIKSRIKLTIFQYVLLFEQIIELFLRNFPPGIHSGCSRFRRLEIIAKIRGGFVINELGLVLTALMISGLGKEPAIAAAVQGRAAFRAWLLPSRFSGGLDGVSACMAIHR